MLNRICLSATALTLALSLSKIAHAQEVTLTAKDNSMTISGTLLGFEDRKYTIRSSLGDITVDADLMDCLGVACPVLKPPAAAFRITGDPLPMADLMPALLEAYGRQSNVAVELAAGPDGSQGAALTDTEGDPLATVEFAGSSSSAGFVDLLQGDAQMVVATRAPNANEAEAFEKTGLGSIQSKDQELLLGLQSIAIIVSDDNPLTAISEETAAGILSGAIRNWSEAGGADAPINVIGPTETSSTTDAISDLLLSRFSASLRGDASQIGNDSRAATRVASDENAIGFVNMRDVGPARALSITGGCGLRSHPSDFAVKSETYPLTRRITAHIAGEMPSQMDGFLTFLASGAATRAAQDAGYYTTELQVQPISNLDERLASAILAGPGAEDITVLQDMVRLMRDAQQLSAALRFVPFTNSLDARSHGDLEQVAALLKTGAFTGKEVVVAGFTTAAADPDQNLPLSAQRANNALRALLSIAPDLEDNVTLTVKGFGDVSPLACASTVASDHINNRIEFWVREARR